MYSVPEVQVVLEHLGYQGLLVILATPVILR